VTASWVSPVALSAQRRSSAIEKLTTLLPPLTLRSSGSAVRLPAMVMVLKLWS